MNASPRRWAAFLLAVALLGGLFIAGSRAQPGGEAEVDGLPPAVEVDDIMLAKLECAQELLAAVAQEDFEGIEINSQKLTILSLDAGWQVLQTPQYTRHSEDFRRSTQAMTLAARNQNLDAAVLAYIDMTMTCVDCHQYVRDPNQADALDLPDLGIEDLTPETEDK